MSTHRHFSDRWTRRAWLRTSAGSAAASSLGGWFGSLAQAMAEPSTEKRTCILLWMDGGASQTDTFDLKPGHDHGGPFHPISSRVPDIQICEHLPGLAGWTDHLAIVRSMSTREGDHGRARDNLRTGYFPQASIQFPVLGSLVAHELDTRAADLPNYVSISSRGLFNPGMPPAGFLGPAFAPLVVGRDGEGEGTPRKMSVENLALPRSVTAGQARERLELLRRLEQTFLDERPGAASDGHRAAYAKAARMMSPSAAQAFDLDAEPAALREQYGDSQFGQGCLLARRLVERGVPFVEVSLGGWDTHEDNFRRVQGLCGVLDKGWAALLEDLKARGLLESTLIVWMGEFGRTPAINPRQGRDHYPKAWSVALAGGPIRGGQVVGRTSPDGQVVEDRPVSAPDLLATICLALGIDPAKQNMSNVGRPIRLVDPTAKPVTELLARA